MNTQKQDRMQQNQGGQKPGQHDQGNKSDQMKQQSSGGAKQHDQAGPKSGQSTTVSREAGRHSQR